MRRKCRGMRVGRSVALGAFEVLGAEAIWGRGAVGAGDDVATNRPGFDVAGGLGRKVVT